VWHAWREDKCVRDFCRKPKDLEDLDTDGKGIIFQWVLKEQEDKTWDDLSGSGHGQAAGCCECGNEISGSI
jgi:hypothetical protein